MPSKKTDEKEIQQQILLNQIDFHKQQIIKLENQYEKEFGKKVPTQY